MRLQMRQTLWAMAVIVGVVMAAGTSYAQTPPPPSPPAGAAQAKPEPVVIPLKVTVVITRFKSDKAQTVVSRMPFELWVNTGSSSTVNFGSEVPVPTTTFASQEGAKSTPVTSFNYRSIGTQLTVEARDRADGRFSIAVSINDAQIMQAPTFDPAVGGPRAAFQTIRAQATTIVRDGQTVQHSLSSDRVSGDLTRVDVTVNVVK